MEGKSEFFTGHQTISLNTMSRKQKSISDKKTIVLEDKQRATDNLNG